MIGPYEESVEYLDLLIRAAMLQSGFILEEPHELAIPLEKLVKVGLGLDRDAKAEVIEFEISEDEKDSSEEDDDKKGEAEVETEEADEGEKKDDSVYENLDEYYAAKGLNPDGTPKEEDQADNNNDEAEAVIAEESTEEAISEEL